MTIVSSAQFEDTARRAGRETHTEVLRNAHYFKILVGNLDDFFEAEQRVRTKLDSAQGPVSLSFGQGSL